MPALTPTLMTWNVRYFSQPTGGLRSTEAGVEGVAEAVAEAGPEILMLQEVEQDSLRAGRAGRLQVERLAEALRRRGCAYRVLYYPAHRYGPAWLPLYTTGLATLIREDIPILAHNADAPADITHRRFPLFARWKQTRIAACARVELGRAAALLVNTHLSLPAFLTPDLLHIHDRMGEGANQVREVEALMEAVAGLAGGVAGQGAGEAVIVAGDLNSTPGTAVMRAFGRAGLRDGFAEAIPASRYRGWTTQALGGRRLHLDHVLVSAGVRPLGIGASHAAGAGRFDGLSDHVPKMLRFGLS